MTNNMNFTLKRLSVSYNIFNIVAMLLRLVFWLIVIAAVVVAFVIFRNMLLMQNLGKLMTVVFFFSIALYVVNRIANFFENKAYQSLFRYQQLKNLTN